MNLNRALKEDDLKTRVLVFTKGYRPDIDGLRAFAVLSVLFFHVGFSGFSGGYVGVDVFFVISGFLITRIIRAEVLSTKSFSFSNFYNRRVHRLFPALFFTLCISFIFAFLLFTPEHLQRFGGSLIYTTMSISNFYFWSESGYFDTSIDFKPLLHTWSLSVEEQFYLLWPATLVILLKLPKYLYLIIIILSCVFSLFLNFVFADGSVTVLTGLSAVIASWFKDGASSIFFLLPFRVFEFGIGAILVWMIQFQPRNKLTLEPILLIGLLMIAYSVFSYDKNTLFPSYNALIPCLGAAFVIYAGTARFSGYLLRNRLSVGIGLISYSLYLIHWPVIVFYKYLVGDISLTERWLIIVASIVFAGLMYRFIETPFRKRFGALNGSNSAFGLTCAMMILVIILPASTLWASSGWDWRVPPLPADIVAQLKDSKQFHKDQYGGEGYPYTGWIHSNENEELASLVLIGDSHARQYAKGLDLEIGKSNKSIYIASTSCITLPGITRFTPGQDWDKLCSGVLINALKVLDSNPDAILLISQSWGSQLTLAADILTGNHLDPNIEHNGPYSFSFILKKLDELKERIGDRKLIIVGNVPGAGINNLIGCFNRPQYIKSQCGNLLAFKEESGAFFKGNKLLSDYASRNENIYFLDPYDVFCSKGICHSLLDNKIQYSDKFHLSKEGSISFVKHFRTTILNLVP